MDWGLRLQPKAIDNNSWYQQGVSSCSSEEMKLNAGSSCQLDGTFVFAVSSHASTPSQVSIFKKRINQGPEDYILPLILKRPTNLYLILYLILKVEKKYTVVEVCFP